MSKKTLRQAILARMNQVSSERRQKLERFFINELTVLPQWQSAKVVGITVSMFPEWETRGIIQEVFKQGKRVVLPKVISKDSMIFVEFKQGDRLIKSAFGVEEPIGDEYLESIDLMIVPGVGFNEQGDRLGFGGGYYDRYLAHFKGHTVALVAREQICHVPVERHDIPVRQLIIEKIR